MPVPISVVIPAFNAERFIRQAIKSVQNHTVKVAEIIVVDDGCTDQTAEIAKEMGVIVLEKPDTNQGVATARNRGVYASGGDWIAWLDADDLWEKRKIEYQWHAIQACPDAGLVSCYSKLALIGSPQNEEDLQHIESLKFWLRPPKYQELKNQIKINRYCHYFLTGKRSRM